MTKQAAKFPTQGIWLVAIAVAFATGFPISFFISKAPWLICIPILLGTSIICWFEFSGWELNRDQPELPWLKMPSDFLGLSSYRRHIWFSFQASQPQTDQEIFDFLRASLRKPIKSPRIFKNPETGEDIYVIDSERFVTLLVNKMLPESDKAAEAALRLAWARYSKMKSVSNEFHQFLNDRSVLDVIKSDFRANTIQIVNRSGEAIIRSLIKAAQGKEMQP